MGRCHLIIGLRLGFRAKDHGQFHWRESFSDQSLAYSKPLRLVGSLPGNATCKCKHWKKVKVHSLWTGTYSQLELACRRANKYFPRAILEKSAAITSSSIWSFTIVGAVVRKSGKLLSSAVFTSISYMPSSRL